MFLPLGIHGGGYFGFSIHKNREKTKFSPSLLNEIKLFVRKILPLYQNHLP
nr:MAG TPA: hypothetical protein [Caudoviricetes sp.]DAS73643.1 MAG TPA: hypothetical protein [Caudoviricetes sp.]